MSAYYTANTMPCSVCFFLSPLNNTMYSIHSKDITTVKAIRNAHHDTVIVTCSAND
jgi:hypothetical protein